MHFWLLCTAKPSTRRTRCCVFRASYLLRFAGQHVFLFAVYLPFFARMQFWCRVNDDDDDHSDCEQAATPFSAMLLFSLSASSRCSCLFAISHSDLPIVDKDLFLRYTLSLYLLRIQKFLFYFLFSFFFACKLDQFSCCRCVYCQQILSEMN